MLGSRADGPRATDFYAKPMMMLEAMFDEPVALDRDAAQTSGSES